jgi:hypothetical protein
MNSIYGTAIYKKNIPTAERILRVLVAGGATFGAWAYAGDPRVKWALGMTAGMALLTGVFGFCPACYFAGRKLSSKVAAGQNH